VASPLAESLAAGDREAFATLYDRLAPRLFATARTMLASTAEAEDGVHDLFVELARMRQRLAAVADLDGYVFTMLRHAAITPAHTDPVPAARPGLRPIDLKPLLEEDL